MDKSLISWDVVKGQFGQILMRISIASIITYYTMKWMVNHLDPTSKGKRNARKLAEQQLKRLNVSGINDILQNLTDYELMIASHLVVPDDIAVSWKDIAGLDNLIQELRESVVLPVIFREKIKDSKLSQAPKGVLLYGPPGCGKTLIAKATAKEAGMRFINLDVSILTDKWYGETQKLASAVFSLASKIQPCIIFIDEIDSFLRSRSSNDHEATAMMKTQFMTLWDGLITKADTAVIIMGATNRPRDLDKAILRRMPAQFYIGLPSETQRKQILLLILANESVDTDVSYEKLANSTNGFSGSDLCEMCRNASIYRMREYLNLNDQGPCSTSSNVDKSLQPISMEHLLRSLKKFKESKYSCNVLEGRMDLD